jgi:hypothetical protein
MGAREARGSEVMTTNGGSGTVGSANTTTVADVLRRAKQAIDTGLHEAAELIGIAQSEYGATQREIATAVGMSVGWVNRLLKWRASGFKTGSPFGPGSKASRARRKRVQATEQVPRKATRAARVQATEHGEEAEEVATVANALDEFKSAVAFWFPQMTFNERVEGVQFVLKQKGAVSS